MFRPEALGDTERPGTQADDEHERAYADSSNAAYEIDQNSSTENQPRGDKCRPVDSPIINRHKQKRRLDRTSDRK